jgi:hypothetical protein
MVTLQTLYRPVVQEATAGSVPLSSHYILHTLISKTNLYFQIYINDILEKLHVIYLKRIKICAKKGTKSEENNSKMADLLRHVVSRIQNGGGS